jgi:hypothetical protein
VPDNTVLSEYQGAGAGALTAAQDHLGPGPDSSRTMANTDLLRVNAIKDRFNNAATKHDFPPALLAAIASRETRCGNVLRDGWGVDRHAFGIMKVDQRSHEVVGTPDPRSQAHIDQAAGILAGFFATMKQKFSDHPERDSYRPQSRHITTVRTLPPPISRMYIQQGMIILMMFGYERPCTP